MAWTSGRVMWDRNSPYQYRDDNLKALGFKSYRAYLKSELWKSIRARVIARDQKCVRCRRRQAAFQVHHRAYDPATLRGDNINSLSTVCPKCHKRAERPEDLTRTRYDRLTEASANVLKEPKLVRRHRAYAADECAPCWARHLSPPTGTTQRGPRKRSESR